MKLNKLINILLSQRSRLNLFQIVKKSIEIKNVVKYAMSAGRQNNIIITSKLLKDQI